MTKSKHEPSSASARSVTEIREDFRAADQDHDGRINLLEFREFVRNLDSDVTDEELVIGFREIDADRDGSINLQEFLAWWTAD